MSKELIRRLMLAYADELLAKGLMRHNYDKLVWQINEAINNLPGA